jgi:fibrillarin-like rRNA methylase
VYVVSSDYVAHMAGKRPNVVTITGDHYSHYRMLLGMVDAVFGEIDHPLGPLGHIDYHLPQKVLY